MNTREEVIKHKFHELIMVTILVPIILAWSVYEMQHSGNIISQIGFVFGLQGVFLVPFAWATGWWKSV